MFTNAVFLNAYRFSSYELKKMEFLKELFVTNGYHLAPDRYPEVYYDDFNKIRGHLHDDPDPLGVYIPSYKNEVEYDALCNESNEGVIVLFKDRIKHYCQTTGANEADIRFVVLMHELGHWLTHWAEYPAAKTSNKRWIYGKNLYPVTKRTHEALAQLIAYWACKGNPAHEKTLFDMSPKIAGSSAINPADPYGSYIKLVGIPQSTILKKIGELRMFWIFKDARLMEFLSDITSIDIVEWIEIHPDTPAAPTDIYNSKWDTWIEEKVKKQIIDKKCSESYSWEKFITSLKTDDSKCVDFFPLLANRLYKPILTHEDMADEYNADQVNTIKYIRHLSEEDRKIFIKTMNDKYPDVEVSEKSLNSLGNLDDLGFFG